MSEEDRKTASMDKRVLTAGRQPSLQTPPRSNEVGNGASKFLAQSSRKDFSSAGRNDPGGFSRKSNQPKSARSFDKRSKSRGSYSSCAKEEVAKADPLFEVSAASFETKVSSKKGNLNHMLNFHFDAVHGTQSGGYFRPYRSEVRGGFQRGGSSGKMSFYNKERFLQANCQFVVREEGNYSVHSVNPDTLVDWEHIEQVRIFGHEVPSCPICLYPPQAAKITRCGHIYCWPCMLHYLSLEDKSWRKCPICYESIHEKDLKSVMVLQTTQFSVGQTITMKLMKKGRGEMRVAPRALWDSHGCHTVSVRDSASISYAKLLMADIEYIEGILELERTHLMKLLKDEKGNSLEESYILAALESLEKRQMSLAGHEVTKMMRKLSTIDGPPVQTEPSPAASAKVVPKQPAKVYLSAFDDEEGIVVETALGVAEEISVDLGVENEANFKDSCIEDGEASQQDEDIDEGLVFYAEPECQVDSQMEELAREELIEEALTVDTASAAGSEDHDSFYFYQAADGQHIYMHALNIRCMKRQYGSLACCPDQVTARILELEGVFMDEDLRRRLRYLNHLPLSCEFQMAELDLKPPLVSKEVLECFTSDIQKRRDTRQKKEKMDKKRACRIQQEENQKMGIDPTVRIIRSEYTRGGGLAGGGSGAALSQMLESPSSASLLSSVYSTEIDTDDGLIEFNSGIIIGSPKSEGSSEDNSNHSGLSFAQMLKTGKAKSSEAWPKVATQSAEQRGRWPSECSKGSESENELQAPEFRASFGDALEKRLADLDKNSNHGEANCDGGSPVAGKGKKKKKKMLLFSTGSMVRNK